jgi:hypothetical protein
VVANRCGLSLGWWKCKMNCEEYTQASWVVYFKWVCSISTKLLKDKTLLVRLFK